LGKKFIPKSFETLARIERENNKIVAHGVIYANIT
jgi:hypothetical protein